MDASGSESGSVDLSLIRYETTARGRCNRLCYSFLFFSGLFVFGVFALDESQVLRLAVLLTGVVSWSRAS